jgi:hypothetical protein
MNKTVKGTEEGGEPALHRVRITLTSRNLKAIEGGKHIVLLSIAFYSNIYTVFFFSVSRFGKIR